MQVAAMDERKRGRLGLEDGRAAVKAILELNTGQLFADNMVTPLPYPGIGMPSERPPFELYYVGTQAAYDLFIYFGVQRAPSLVIEGPRGFGKSSDLRALACIVYKFIYQTGKRERLVCMWNTHAALNDVVSVVRDAILFAYLFPPNSSSSIEEIRQISSIEEAVKFIKQRKATEDFYFFVDSWELLDETDSKGKPSSFFQQRVVVQQKLERLFAEGKQVWYAASAKSHAATADVHKLCKFRPFNEVQYRAYLSHNILGKVQGREKDINYYTGRVPMFLDVLCNCCMKLPSPVHPDEKEKLRQAAIHESDLEMVLEMSKDMFLVRDVDQIVELLQEDYNWGFVLKLFREHEALEQVKRTINNISIERSCHKMEEMGKVDATYFIRQSNRYCSDFISRMYIEAFRAKEAQIQKHRGGAWIPYCRFLVRQPDVNWSNAGWVVEELMVDIVKHNAVNLGNSLGRISGLEVLEFTDIPILYISEILLKMRGGHGYYYKPCLFSIPYVDGIVLCVDNLGHLHIIGLQVTDNMDDHLLSAVLFMSIQDLKSWFPDIERNLGKVQLHFVYIGWSKKWLEEVREDDQQVQMKELKGGKSYWIAAHKRTYVPLSIALAALSEDDLDVVQEVVQARVSQLPKLPLTFAALWHLKREELEEIAQQYGIINPKQYSKDDLISQLEKLS